MIPHGLGQGAYQRILEGELVVPGHARAALGPDVDQEENADIAEQPALQAFPRVRVAPGPTVAAAAASRAPQLDAGDDPSDDADPDELSAELTADNEEDMWLVAIQAALDAGMLEDANPADLTASSSGPVADPCGRHDAALDAREEAATACVASDSGGRHGGGLVGVAPAETSAPADMATEFRAPAGAVGRGRGNSRAARGGAGGAAREGARGGARGLPASSEADGCEREREAHADILRSSRWGVSGITPKQPGSAGSGRFGGWEARCPFHKLNDKSGCKRFLRITGPSPQDQTNTLRRLLYWCSVAQEYNRQRLHLGFLPPLEECPPVALIMSRKITDKPQSVKTDDALDAEEAGGAAPIGAAGRQMRPAGRGTPTRGAAASSSSAAPPVASSAGGPAPPETTGGHALSSSSSSSSSSSDSSESSEESSQVDL